MLFISFFLSFAVDFPLILHLFLVLESSSAARIFLTIFPWFWNGLIWANYMYLYTHSTIQIEFICLVLCNLSLPLLDPNFHYLLICQLKDLGLYLHLSILSGTTQLTKKFIICLVLVQMNWAHIITTADWSLSSNNIWKTIGEQLALWEHDATCTNLSVTRVLYLSPNYLWFHVLEFFYICLLFLGMIFIYFTQSNVSLLLCMAMIMFYLVFYYLVLFSVVWRESYIFSTSRWNFS